MENVKQKLQIIVEIEYRWWYLYKDCDDYYTKLEALDRVYGDLLKALYQSYFGEELGILLYDYCSDDIYDGVRNNQCVPAIVDQLYDLYWPNPEKKIEACEKRYREALKQMDEEIQERYRKKNEKLDEVCYKIRMSPEELFSLFTD